MQATRNVVWMIYSFGTCSSWTGAFERYLRIEELLVAQSPCLHDQEECIRMFGDYFLISESYREKIVQAIDNGLENSIYCADVEADLFVLREVYRCGPVVMG